MTKLSSKEEVHYRKGSTAEHCGICTMFVKCRNKQDINRCTAVEGDISFSAICDYFKKKLNEEELTENQKYCKIQIQDQTGIWRDRSITINDSQYIRRAMASTQMSYPKYRVRAISYNGSIIDILTPGSLGPR